MMTVLLKITVRFIFVLIFFNSTPYIPYGNFFSWRNVSIVLLEVKRRLTTSFAWRSVNCFMCW